MKPIVYKSRPKLIGKITYIDAYSSALEELFFLEHPNLKKNMPEMKEGLKQFLLQKKVQGSWIYYPLQKKLVHTVEEKLYFKLRTARNRNIISETEQQYFRNTKIGIAGLSVGSAILEALVISGGPKYLKIADFDNLEITNLNRIRASLLDIGQNKTAIAARRCWELDPFAQIQIFDTGLNTKNLKQFLLKPKLNIFIDEMDSLDLKIQTRLICKKNKLPVLMATDNGDSVILDVERFDIEPKRQIFHGLLSEVNIKNLKNLSFKQWLTLATKIVGPQHLTNRMRDSILLIGKTLPAVPQLGSSASMAGAAISFCVRKIANRQNLPSGRYIISLEEKLDVKFSSAQAKKQRKQNIKKFVKNLLV